MTSLIGRSARLIARHPAVVVIIWALVVAASALIAIFGVGGPTIFDQMETSRPAVPGSDSQTAYDLMGMGASSQGAAVVELVQGVDLADPVVAARAEAVVAAARPSLAGYSQVVQVADPWIFPSGPSDPAAAGLVSQSGDGFIVRVVLADGLAETVAKEAGQAVADRLDELGQAVVAAAGGSHLTSSGDLVTRSLNEEMEAALFKAEAISLPVALLVMMVVFGGFLPAGMPVIGALAAITAGLGGMLLINTVMDLDSVIVNVITIIGLGLSVDYGLLMVSRFREELSSAGAVAASGPSRRDAAVQQAVYRTVVTAGRTIVFSALTIAVCILSLLTMRPPLLKGIAAGGAMSVLLAMLAATSLVPAVLCLLGRHFLRPSPLRRIPGVRHLVAGVGDKATDHGVFAALARWVQRRAWPAAALALALLIALASLIGTLQLRSSSLSLLDPATEQGQYYAAIGRDYPLLAASDLYVVSDAAADDATVRDRLAAVEHVAYVGPASDLGAGVRLFQVNLAVEDSGGPEASAAVEAIRSLGLPLHVAGDAADQLDFKEALLDGLPLAAVLVTVVVFLLLFLMTASFVVPLKALIVNGLSIAASLGLSAWIFTADHGFATTGLEIYVVALAVAFGFGLAMDYEVFLLDRIKETYDRTGANDLAVRRGLQRSGRIITSAAAVIIVVFLGFALGRLEPLQQAGIILAIVVALDASLVRMILVPATMTILGRLNWWAPRPLQKLAAGFAIGADQGLRLPVAPTSSPPASSASPGFPSSGSSPGLGPAPLTPSKEETPNEDRPARPQHRV
ncbi:MAG: MMPL family transporter [Propionibacteriaceae bacterium]|jgi:RND superfamily putative drug exporter|nr:MMPL family transporter [Propionibacteriaceae bacterium]